MNECLSLRGVSKSYHAGIRGCSATITVLRAVDLTVGAGELVAISAGPAAGKTTLLMCAAGLMRPDRGVVSWFGGPPRRDGAARPDGIAYAGDRPFPYGFLSVREALEYAAIVRDLPLRDSARRVACALDRTRLAAVADRRVDAVSGSDLARLSLAGALLSEPRLLIVDDVPSGCDAATAQELTMLLHILARDGAGVVVAGRLVQWIAAATGVHPRAPSRILSLVAGQLVEGGEPLLSAGRRPAAAASHARVAEIAPATAPRQNGGR
jgi:ABC-type multidrug transport system ATPase subunit